jgi:AcrR family transcriptional regulator
VDGVSTVPAETDPKLRADARRNRELLLAAAAEAFAEHGLDVGVAEIARRAGVGTATLFRRFPTKDDLILAVVHQRIEEVVDLFESGLQDPDPWCGLVGPMTTVTKMQSVDRGFFEAVGEHLHNDPAFGPLRHRVQSAAARLVARAQEAGVVRGDLAAEDVLLLLKAAAQAADLAGDAVPGLHERYLGIIFDGLRPEAATPLPCGAPTFDQLDAAAISRRRREDRPRC